MIHLFRCDSSLLFSLQSDELVQYQQRLRGLNLYARDRSTPPGKYLMKVVFYTELGLEP